VQREGLILEIENLNSQAWSLNNQNSEKAIELANLALERASSINYEKGIALAKKTLGACYIYSSQNDKGAQYCVEANEGFKSLKDKLNGAAVYIYLGDNFFNLSDYEGAIKCYRISYELSSKINHEQGMADALNGIGTVYYSTGKNQEALKVLLESENICKKNNNLLSLVKVQEGLGESSYNLKQYEKALIYFEDCAGLTKYQKNDHAQARAYNGLGKTYTALGEYETALENYNKCLKIFKKTAFKSDEAITLNNIGALYTCKKETKKAVKYLLNAFELATEIDAKESIYLSCEKLAELYELENDIAEAFKYYKIFHKIKEEVKNFKSEQLAKSFALQRKVLQSEAEKAIIEERGKEQENFSESLTLMSQIGQQIISSLSVETIVNTVYESVNGLMDATGFGIGLYQKLDNTIVYPLYIEGEERFKNVVFELNDNNRLTVLCYNTAKEIIINHFEREIGKYVKEKNAPLKAGKHGESLIYLPLKYKDTLQGVITVQSFRHNAYSNYHVNILKNLAAYTAIALENANLYQEQEQKVAELEKTFENTRLVSEIGKEISSTFSIREIISGVYNSVNKLMDANMFGIGIYDPKTEQINFSGAIENGKILGDYFYSLNSVERPAIWCFTNQKDYIVSCFTEEFINKNKITDSEILQEDTQESIIYLPVTQNNKKIGVITVQSYNANAYNDYHLQLLKSLAIYVAIAIDNASLYNNMEEHTDEVHKQKTLIEEKNKDITDSIKYAKIIQQAIAPNIDEFNKNFTDSFILYKPKDIVSGDFYWFEHFGETTVFAAADCTGHGVPGAFMSLICNEIMFKVITEQKMQDPGKALTLIDEKLVKLIKKSSEASSNDGMDIALCTYEKRYKILSYAGAHRPLILIRNKEVIEYKPNIFSIGGYSTAGKYFDMTEIKVKTGDVVYLLSDGYTDQFGGPKGKKFMIKNFKELVVTISDKPMKEQKQILDDTFESWRGSLRQVDDVCVIGVKI
jgi:transcriptional regulator with GAF, ATPase, and Fis domain/tetratricopeptide (TPR) repeat protein